MDREKKERLIRTKLRAGRETDGEGKEREKMER